MGLLQFPSQQIFPKSPKTASYYASGRTQNTWYTLLSVTAGTGILKRVVFMNDIATNNQMEIKITVDGVANTLASPSSLIYSRALVHNNTAGSPGSYNSPFGYMYDSPVYFYTSLTVEIRHTNVSSCTFDAICDYSLI